MVKRGTTKFTVTIDIETERPIHYGYRLDYVKDLLDNAVQRLIKRVLHWVEVVELAQTERDKEECGRTKDLIEMDLRCLLDAVKTVRIHKDKS